MRIELTLDKRNKLPDGALEALNHEFSKRVNHIYPDTAVQVRMTNSNTLTVMGGLKSDKERIEEVLQETWKVPMTGSITDLANNTNSRCKHTFLRRNNKPNSLNDNRR